MKKFIIACKEAKQNAEYVDNYYAVGFQTDYIRWRFRRKKYLRNEVYLALLYP